MRSFTFFVFILLLWNPVCRLWLQHVPIWLDTLLVSSYRWSCSRRHKARLSFLEAWRFLSTLSCFAWTFKTGWSSNALIFVSMVTFHETLPWTQWHLTSPSNLWSIIFYLFIFLYWPPRQKCPDTQSLAFCSCLPSFFLLQESREWDFLGFRRIFPFKFMTKPILITLAFHTSNSYF